MIPGGITMYTVRISGAEPKIFEKYEDAVKFTDENIRYGCTVEDGERNLLYAPFGKTAADILYEVKQICDYVRDNEFNYGDAPINPAVDCGAKLVSCDRLVGWALYRIGYTDQPESHGLCVSGPQLTEWCARHGFRKIDSVDELIPGDIVFVNMNRWECPGHVFIFASKSDKEGEYYRYDCGKTERIRSTQPSLEPINGFMYGYRVRPVGDEITPSLSFTYDGKPFEEVRKNVEVSEDKITYTMSDGLVVESRIRRYKNSRVIRWTNYWYNPTDHDSGLVTDLWDCDVNVPFEPDPQRTRRNRQKDWQITTTQVISMNGANVTDTDYIPIPSRIWADDGKPYHNSCAAGRSGMQTEPYFDINRRDYGVIFAIGWTGQWHTDIKRNTDSVNIRSGIEHAAFRVRPGESFRTSSTAMLMYYDGQDEGHNRFRDFMREISPLGGKGRGEQSPFSAIFWGGINSENLLRRWENIINSGLPFDTCWVDAGWYEPLRSTTTDTQTAEWPRIGTWEVNKFYHPDGYNDVTSYLHKNGIRFMVWFEPERINKPTAEWLPALEIPGKEYNDVLTALNRDDVCDSIIEKISDCIEKMHVDIYRQDCNIAPLGFWLANDEPERGGITEIKYINNLYRFWDALLTRFPNLLIDNCAGGGHRNDFEMLSRAVPLWRSDFQCTWDCSPESNQLQNASSAWFIPYSGIGYGPTLGDTYSWRSAYTDGITVRTWEHVDPEWDFGAMNEPIDWAKKYFDEFVSVRRYFTKDYYMLLPISRENTSWCAQQFHDKETHSGIILAFRRPESPYSSVHVSPGGLRPFIRYEFTNADTGEKFVSDGLDLIKNGLDLTLSEKRSSLLLTYKPV